MVGVALADQSAHLAARRRGELAEVEATAAGAKELAEARLAEIGRLVAQIPAAGGPLRGWLRGWLRDPGDESAHAAGTQPLGLHPSAGPP